MLFLFGITISLNLTFEKWTEIQKEDNPPPALIFSWAPWCPHCRAVFESWSRLSEKYQSDPNVQVFSLNCTDQSKLCGSFPIRGYPTFFTYVNKVIEPVNVQRTLDGFTQVCEGLKKKYQSVLDFKKKLESAQHPFFVFRTRESDDAAIDIATRSAQEVGLIQDKNYFFNYDNDHQQNCQITVHLTSDYFKKFKGKFTSAQVLGFLNEYKNEFFGKWSFDSIVHLERLFILILDNQNAINEIKDNYKNVAVKYDELATFGDFNQATYHSSDSSFISSSVLRNLFKISSSVNNAAIVLNMKKSSFTIIENSTPKKVEQLIENSMKQDSSIKWQPFEIPTAKGKSEQRNVKQIGQRKVQKEVVNHNDVDAVEPTKNSESKNVIFFIGFGVLMIGFAGFAYKYYTTVVSKDE